MSAIKQIRDGFTYVLANSTIMSLMIMVSLIALFGFSFITLLPAWSVEVLGGDVKTNGLLNSARGFGALIGALSIASLGRFKFRGKLLSLGTLLFPALMILFSFARWLPVSLLILSGIGAALVMIMNLANSLVQTNTEDAFRGRVSSIYTLTFFGFMPIGSLLMGQVAEFTSEPAALQLGGLVLLVAAILTWLAVPRLHRLE
jgi:predicted MFS family arabinose efflux permease